MSVFMPSFGFATMNLVGALLWFSVQHLDLETGEPAGDGTGSRTPDGMNRQPCGRP